jgi:hypothetical protein
MAARPFSEKNTRNSGLQPKNNLQLQGSIENFGGRISIMPLVCPQCKQLFEKNGICPLCNVVLLYHAQNLQSGPAPTVFVEDDSSHWQQTPWGKILIGLILAQGLSFGLQHLLTAGLLANGDSADHWNTVLGIVLHHAALAVSLLIGGGLSGAGQSRGLVYGAFVGLASGIISLLLQNHKTEAFASVLIYAEPLIHLATGAIGGALGMLIWRPTPKIPELENSTPTPIPLPNFSIALARLLTGPVHIGRVCAGAFIIVMGVVWSQAILEFLLRASNGSLALTSKLQAQLVSMEIIALVVLLGAGFAGATTRNGFKQGLCVGLAASAIVLGVQISNPKFAIEAAISTLSGIILVALVGGWFGSQLFPPVDPSRRKRRLSYHS